MAAPAPTDTPDTVEQEFYDALRHGDIERLMAVWADDPDIGCVHPGGARLVGAAAIRRAFESIFASGPVDVHPEQVRRLHTPDCAVHAVQERVRLASVPRGRSAWVVATNVYLLTAQGWRLASHHASPGSAPPSAEDAEPAPVLH